MHLHSCPHSSSFCDQSVAPLAEGERCLNWIKCAAIVLRALWLVFFFTFDSSCFTHILHVSSKLVYTNWLSLVPAFISGVVCFCQIKWRIRRATFLGPQVTILLWWCDWASIQFVSSIHSRSEQSACLFFHTSSSLGTSFLGKQHHHYHNQR